MCRLVEGQWVSLDLDNHWAGIAATFNITHAKRHYYGGHRKLNPSGIVPAGPLIDFG